MRLQLPSERKQNFRLIFSERSTYAFLEIKYVIAMRGISAVLWSVAPFLVGAILMSLLAILVFPKDSLLVLALVCFIGMLAGVGIARYTRSWGYSGKSWFALLTCCIPQTIGEPFVNALCERREMMHLQGCSKPTIVWETVRQLISLFVKEGMYQVLEWLIPVKKPKIG